MREVLFWYALGFVSTMGLGVSLGWKSEEDGDEAVARSIALVLMSLVWPLTLCGVMVMMCVWKQPTKASDEK